ncbi:MAG: type II toxin-antitoxin system HicB family antitoxin [Prevotellaceae bacterium]|nr:type II toxin-antitoxin system HicB family antitoxin [Prevotellaceae bacterium]
MELIIKIIGELNMDKLEYKGYLGNIEYSKEDDCLYGNVLGMPKDLISYEGNTASELIENFKGSIDMYLEHCERKGIKPRKAYNGVLNVRIPSEIHCKIANLANANGISINAFIRESIEMRLYLNNG